MPKAPVLQIIAALVLMACLAVPLPALAQALPRLAGPDQNQDKDQEKDQTEDQSVSTLKVNVDVVQLFFNVKDKKGALIPNLTKDDFEVFEDGKPQTIKYFSAESNLPLTLGILIDSSPSQTRVLDMEKEVGGSFVNQIVREKDLAFVIGFDADVNLLQEFINSTRILRQAMNGAHIGGGGGGGFSGVPGLEIGRAHV